MPMYFNDIRTFRNLQKSPESVVPHVVDLGVPRSSRGSGTSKIKGLACNRCSILL